MAENGRRLQVEEQTRAERADRQRGARSAEIENAAFHCHICCCIDSRAVHSIDSAFKSRAETIMAGRRTFALSLFHSISPSLRPEITREERGGAAAFPPLELS